MDRFILLVLSLALGSVALAQTEPEQPAGQAAPAEEAAAQPEQAQQPQPVVWLEDALPEGAAADGEWLWDSQTFASGLQSHGHPAGEGLRSHGFSVEKPVSFTSDTLVQQEVWLDPKAPPAGIAVRFRLISGEEVGVYWEGEEEVFTPAEYEELWYYGLLPELGIWTTLEILAEDLGLEDEQITGVTFLTHGGRALWDRTILTRLPVEEEGEPFEFATPTLPHS